MKSFIFIVLLCIVAVLAKPHTKRSDIVWSYSDVPAWSTACEECAVCGNGIFQSPIDIKTQDTVKQGSVPIALVPMSGMADVYDTGHNVKAGYVNPLMNSLNWGSEYYPKAQLLQFHYHTPSEHTVDGQSFPLEIHLVHISGDKLFVVGIFFKPGAHNPAVDQLLTFASDKDSSTPRSVSTAGLFDSCDLGRYWTYTGSLTTPPCSEGVRWFVLKDPVEASAAQIQQFVNIHGVTNRPVQHNVAIVHSIDHASVPAKKGHGNGNGCSGGANTVINIYANGGKK